MNHNQNFITLNNSKSLEIFIDYRFKSHTPTTYWDASMFLCSSQCVYVVCIYGNFQKFSPGSSRKEVNSKMWRWNMMINSRMRRGGGLSILIWSTFISNICSALYMIKMSKQHEEDIREWENEFDYWWRCFTILFFSFSSFHSLIKL
jgi:hypothetical protein